MNRRGFVSAGIELTPSTIYRFLNRNGLMKLTGSMPQDRRKFEAELPNDIYHSRKHSSTGQTPFARFSLNTECLRESPANLQDYFRKVARRRVAKDRTVSLNSRIYEAPVSLIGKQVSLLYHEQDPEYVEVTFDGQSYWIARCTGYTRQL